jgi:hypothetical protein
MSEIDYIPIHTCKAALELATPEQSEAIDELLRNWRANAITVGIDSGLPHGYLCFTVEAFGGATIHGGIAPDGLIST